MPVRSSLRCSVFVALLPLTPALWLDAQSPALWLDAQSQPAPKPSATTTSDASMPMPQVAPLFIENGYFTSSLYLLNAAATHTYADVTLRTANGHDVVHKRVEFQPNSERKLEIQELLRQVDYKEIFGSVELTSDNNGVVIGQIAIAHQAADDETFIDEEFAMPMHGDSGVLRGISAASSYAPLLSLVNLEMAPQKVSVTCYSEAGDARVSQITLASMETRFVQSCGSTLAAPDVSSLVDSFPQLDSSHSFGIEISGGAGPSSVAAFGVTPQRKKDKVTFSSIAFDDTTYHRAATVFTGVPVGPTSELNGRNYLPHLTLANFSAWPQVVTVKADRTANGFTSSDEVIKLTMPPHSSTSLDLNVAKPSAEMQNSFVISSTGSAADVLAKLYSYVPDQPEMIELQPKDEADRQNGGNHPWDLDDGSEAYLLLYNSGDSARGFEVSIGTTGIIWEKAYHLAPDETRSISIRDLLASKTVDDYGRTLPPNLTSGSVQWFAGRLHGRGRLARIYANEGRARNFSCGGSYWICGAYTGTGQTSLSNGTSTYMSITPQMCTYVVPPGSGGESPPTGGTTCGGNTSGQQSGNFNYNWSVSPYSIVNFQGSINASSVTLVGSQSGTATVTGSVLDSFNCSASRSQQFTVSNSCPTSVTVATIARPNLPDVDIPSSLTGIGILTQETVSPPTPNGVQLQESVQPIVGSNTCPASIKQYTDFPTIALGTSPFYVGANVANWEGRPYPSVPNAFYDSHRTLINFDILGGTGVNQCSAQAGQIYYCQGKPIGTFVLKDTYTHGVLNGVGVTYVYTTEQ